MYAYWVCAAREITIFSPKFPFRSISFSQMTKKSGHHHFTFFFKTYLISTRSPPPMAGSARTQSVRQRPGLAAGQSASQTRPGSSGAPHFHARPWSSFPSPGRFFHFAAAHTYQNLGWVPPPPSPGSRYVAASAVPFSHKMGYFWGICLGKGKNHKSMSSEIPFYVISSFYSCAVSKL